MIGIYSNLYYPTRWVPLKRRGLGWHRCCKVYEEHRCVASCGLAEGKILEVVLDVKGCNLNCKYCWGWKIRFENSEVRKMPEEVVKDVLCQIERVSHDRLVKKRKYRVGVVRFTGNEPTLQWDHILEVLKLLDKSDEAEKLKVIIETNGILAGMGKINFQELEKLENLRVDVDVSFKGVNYEQFEWLSSTPKKLFRYQIEGFVRMFDYFEGNERINVNPVLGINHEENYCVRRDGREYFMKVEIIDAKGNKLDFYDYSKDFEELVLSRKELRYDEAPFREYFGINRERARQVVAVVYKGKRYLNVLPSEVVELVEENS
ncbi:Radical SAM domain protein [Ferroglobus placidus DSM 10642]|uniref:Radical SAM domain protein n=1 Tax=Ferroglobus placidus (strain DSM 10642 / AEDII12DO) TaxID=589924 RepID=D3S0J5_FERPA|nr:radical SAM protein [Ferroglobus placidus]ADC64209.1 Radical SAM domain protein [Ferroglobus placidus DSM 10642]